MAVMVTPWPCYAVSTLGVSTGKLTGGSPAEPPAGARPWRRQLWARH